MFEDRYLSLYGNLSLGCFRSYRVEFAAIGLALVLLCAAHFASKTFRRLLFR
ncbi:MAG: hypothetical protein M1153_00905 [Patescibacteria group bacterium]|nr:hypothetical protein [Patescibacteria group bacterium]